MSGALLAVFQNVRTFAIIPGAPTIGTATIASGTSVYVPFTAPVNDGGATITSYTATSSPGGITGTISQAGSGTITVTGLTNSTPYTFTVTATNGVGTSPASAASNSVTPITVAGQARYEGTGVNGGGSSIYTWICPVGVTSVSVVAVGSGGYGGNMAYTTQSGNANSPGGGGLGWKNGIAVTPGNGYTVAVGNNNSSGPGFPTGEASGAASYFISSGTVFGGGGSGHLTRTGGTFVGDNGGNGGTGGTGTNGYPNGPYSENSGAGGAGGYTGNGGNGASGTAAGSAGAGGGGGGGGGGNLNDGVTPGNSYPAYVPGRGGGGGGVGLLGQGSSGAGGVASVPPFLYGGPPPGGGGGGSYSYGAGGTAGENGLNAPSGSNAYGGYYGGGGGTGFYGGYGGVGAVRIMWQGQSPGTPRSFPSNAADV